MTYLPPSVNPGIISNTAFTPKNLERWMDGAPIPTKGPHTERSRREEWGCEILSDFTFTAPPISFKKGMQGHAIGEAMKKDGQSFRKLHIDGVTESRNPDGALCNNVWVPESMLRIGEPWKKNREDWEINVRLRPWNTAATTQPNAPDSSRLGRAIFQLISSFKSSPASFMGTKLEELLEKRGATVQTLAQMIIDGVKKAGMYEVLNRPNFHVMEVIGAARHTINRDYPLDKSRGVYMRRHIATSAVSHWTAGVIYIYIGKTIDFRARFDGHWRSTSKYGDLTRNSRELTMVALCLLDDQQYLDCGFLVEQIFICLFQSYRKSTLAALYGRLDSDVPVERVKTVQAANYFSQLATNIFQQTGFSGGVNRPDFGVEEGANCSSPFVEWCSFSEQTLFVRHDTYLKDWDTMESMPVAVFRTAKPQIAHYHADVKRRDIFRMQVFKKSHNKKGFLFFGFSTKAKDGQQGPVEGDLYHVVFEVRTDGEAHPFSWSRLPSIASFGNWNQGRSLAVRIEWEYPNNSRNWRYRYIQSGKVMNFIDEKQYGCNKNYMKSIAFTRWLFNARDVPNAPDFQVRLHGSAYVLQACYDFLTQTVEIKDQTPVSMLDATLVPAHDISQTMKALGLLNVDGAFGDMTGGHARTAANRLYCDTCCLIGTGLLDKYGLKCKQITKYPNRCILTHLMGRPFCSWTAIAALREPSEFSDLQRRGGRVGQGNTTRLTGDDVAKHRKIITALVRQYAWEYSDQGQGFELDVLEVRRGAQAEDDVEDDGIQVNPDEEESDDGGDGI